MANEPVILNVYDMVGAFKQILITHPSDEVSSVGISPTHPMAVS